MAEFETLYALAELAIAIAGFSAIVVLFCARWRPRALPWFAAWVTMLWFATLYLGYHYLIDTIAALPLAPFSIAAASALQRWLQRAKR